MWWPMLALGAPSEVVWSGELGDAATVDLLGTDADGALAWLLTRDEQGHATGLHQVDLHRGRLDGSWLAEGPTLPRFGWLAPLVGSEADLQRLGVVQAHIVGRPTFPLLSVDPREGVLAWEGPTDDGRDGVLRSEGPALGADLLAAYRPRFHPRHGLVAYVGAEAEGYGVYVEDVAAGERLRLPDVGHADQLAWDGAGNLWVLETEDGRSCLVAVREGPAERLRCGGPHADLALDPAGTLIALADRSEGGLDLFTMPIDSDAPARHRVPGGRTLAALGPELALIAAADGWRALDLDSGACRSHPGAGRTALHPHPVEGRWLVVDHAPPAATVRLAWLDPASFRSPCPTGG